MSGGTRDGLGRSSNDEVAKIFADLGSRDDDVRRQAAGDLKHHVVAVSREISGDSFTRFMNDVNRKIYELVHSTNSEDKISGIYAIDALIDFDGEDNNTKVTRFANYLRLVLPGSDGPTMVLAAKSLGRLALVGSTLTADFVDFEVRRAMEWLQGERQESIRYAAVLVLRELGENAPTLVYGYVAQILDLVWVALRDPKVSIREAAAATLSVCLDLVQARDSQMRIQKYRKILEEAQKCLKSTSPDAVHGGLLAYKELLVHTGNFMDSRFREACAMVLGLRDHRDALVRKTVTWLLPTLAEYEPQVFVREYLGTSMAFLMSQLKSEKDKSTAYRAIGRIAMAVGGSTERYLDSILRSLQEDLSLNRRYADAMFECLSMLAISIGPALEAHLPESLLDEMFASGLSYALRQALIDMARHIPAMLGTIQGMLLTCHASCAANADIKQSPFHPPGAPNRTPLRNTRGSDGTDAAAIILALQTLGAFDFRGHILHEFVRDCVTTYLNDESASVRKAAAVTCCEIFVRDPVNYQSSAHSLEVVGEVLARLLEVGISDPDPSIRQTVLSSLDERFDHHLAQAENIRMLFLSLNDEVFAVRETAIAVIGRLTIHNPAYVMPSLRKVLIQLLGELEYSSVSRSKEEAAKLLSQLMAASQRLVKPYVDPIFKVLLPKTKEGSSTLVGQILGSFGELAQIGGEDLLPFLDKLFPILIDTLQDQSSVTKREAALKTLGQLASSTGAVMTPYTTYPYLLGMLISILKAEQLPGIRKQTVKLLGILGALDPYKHSQLTQSGVTDVTLALGNEQTLTDIPLSMSPTSDEYYPTVAISALMKILRDPSLSMHHTAVMQAIMYIFKTLGLKGVPFLPQIMPHFFAMMRTCPISILEFHFQQLGVLVSIVKQHIRNWLPDVFQLIHDFWNVNASIQITIVALVESIALAMDGEFRAYIPNLLPQLLQIFDTDATTRKQPTARVLQAMIVLGRNLEDSLHLVLPSIVRVIENRDMPPDVQRTAALALGQLCRKVNMAEHAARVIHPLVRALSSNDDAMRTAVMEALTNLGYQMASDFIVFAKLITKEMEDHDVKYPKFEKLVDQLKRGEPLSRDIFADPRSLHPSAETAAKKLPVNQQSLKRAWEASQRSTKEDWLEWIRRLSVELLKESPSHSLRSCASLASAYQPLARELFNAAFVSCWGELYDSYQDEFVQAIKTAITFPNIPPEIVQTLLNLAEFMEHDDRPLPIEISTLGAYAAKCHAYAKALHYKEMEFMTQPITDTIEALISVNNQVEQPDSAVGILRYAQQTHNVELKESWYEKLNRWDDALVAYEKKQAEDPNSVEAMLGRMRCHHALGEWESLSVLAQERWSMAKEDVKRSIAPMAAAAAWGLGQWELMDDYMVAMKPDSPDGAFFRAILCLHRNLYGQAEQHISYTREMLDTELTALLGESFNRAYNVVVRIQMLAELEEIILYKQIYDQPERQAVIRRMWTTRLSGCQRNVDVWQRILRVRSLVMSPKDDMDPWIKFANLCRKSGRLNLCQKTLIGLMPSGLLRGEAQALATCPPRVAYAYIKYMWASRAREQAVVRMDGLLVQLMEATGASSTADSSALDKTDPPPRQDLFRLLARCNLKLGQWQATLLEEQDPDNVPDVLRYYLAATHFDKTWYKAWHAWALANFEATTHYERTNESVPSRTLLGHVVPAVQGFFRSIALSKGNSLQDALRLLTLWFKYGFQQEVNNAVAEGFEGVTIDTWLQVIPQLIARIHTQSPHVRRLIHQLLSDIGREHPQALIYPLTVASKSVNLARKKAALSIMDKMRTHSATLVDQALLVSQELIRVAILWHEMWHEGLEEASRLYFGDHNVEGMFATLEPLHQMLDRGPETLREVSFNQAFGRDLAEALDWCKKYKRTQNVTDLNQAWDLYYHVFRRINKQLPQLTTLELQYVSPKLLAANELELAVPGTYKSNEPIVRIASFAPTLTVITSKQRPRKLTIKGSDGKDYQFLLKGHEDIRQDERVMQLFGLVNTLLMADSETFKRHLNIQRYSVIPLSPNSGLIGWVPHSDTLHALIRDYRESRKILLNIEHRLMLHMAPDYDNLVLLQKVEVFQHALENTTGQDLYKVLWLKSRNSEAWLDRRTNYTRSLAVMSMVGYVLGLGDRHPSNLMLHRYSGKVIHIDFGDCFEVAMHREKFPEKIPFRLTRMLINAMEVSGIEGNFRITCEHVMRVLRDNKDSVMAVLEAFVYDPLINWRLMANLSPKHDDPSKVDGLNTRALAVINRVSNKLTGRDFKPNVLLDVPAQVEKLILQATSIENLCQCYIGCVFCGAGKAAKTPVQGKIREINAQKFKDPANVTNCTSGGCVTWTFGHICTTWL
ncbi:armadillo-type protein [Hyaloraphidium curvatum]|nr:armadillo-type protein [Hyaloraphidium curvatum]